MSIVKAFFIAFTLIAANSIFTPITQAQTLVIASYDVKQRIKELGGGPFCINQFDSWQKGEPRNMYYLGKDVKETCNLWAVGQMSSDRRGKSGVAECTCR
jgi:hypothetical protein